MAIEAELKETNLPDNVDILIPQDLPFLPRELLSATRASRVIPPNRLRSEDDFLTNCLQSLRDLPWPVLVCKCPNGVGSFIAFLMYRWGRAHQRAIKRWVRTFFSTPSAAGSEEWASREDWHSPTHSVEQLFSFSFLWFHEWNEIDVT